VSIQANAFEDGFGLVPPAAFFYHANATIQDAMNHATMPSSSAAALPPRAEELRRRHPRFVYERFTLSRTGRSLRVRYYFRLEPDIDFAPETVFENVPEEIPIASFDNYFFHLGLVEMLSYWKAACSPEIVIRAGSLTADQIAWWKNLLLRGMGEYFYVNQIDFRSPDLIRIVSPRNSEYPSPVSPDSRTPIPESRTLVLASGGKDSAVTFETLRSAGQPFDCLLLNPARAALDIAKLAGCDKPIIVRRTIDRRLLDLNAASYLNGHTPFSALLAFLGTTAAMLFGHRRVIVSNERSAEEATVEYLGQGINHQYSKTFEFETAFRDYARRYLSPGIEYFSLLRPLYELQIAARFAKLPAYFPLFRSCNRGIATNSWCGQCPKCLFVWTVLYPFVDREQLLRIFTRDLFASEHAEDILRALLGLDAAKPFECVGTREETLAAIHLCVVKYRAEGIELPPPLAAIERTVLASHPSGPDLPDLAQRILASWSDHHYLPAELARQLRAVPNLHAPFDNGDHELGS
jgi:hypothetical protein